MADDVKTGIRIEVTGKADFVKDLNDATEAMNGAAAAAGSVEENAGKADGALGKMAEDSAGSSNTFRENLGSAIGVVAAGLAGLVTAALEVNAAIIAVVNEVAENGDKISKGAAKLDFGVEAFQEWDYILGKSDSSMAKATSAIQNLTSASRDASADQSAAFQKIGLSLEKVATMKPDELFASVVSGLQGIEDSGDRAATASELFGSSWKSLGTLLNLSADETEALRQKAHDLSLIMSDEMVQSSVEYQEKLEDLQDIATGVKNTFSAEMMGTVSELRGALVDLVTQVDWKTLAEGLAGIVEPASRFINSLIVPLASYSINAAVTSLSDLIKIIRELEALLSGEQNLGETIRHLENYSNPTTPDAVFQDMPEQADEVVNLALAFDQLMDSMIDTQGIEFDVDPNLEPVEQFLGVVDEFIQKTAELNGDADMSSGNTQAWAQSIREAAVALALFAQTMPDAEQKTAALDSFISQLTQSTNAYKTSQEQLAQSTGENDPAAQLEAAAEASTEAAETLQTNIETTLSELPATTGEVSDAFVEGSSEMSKAAAAAVKETNDTMGQNMATLSANAYVWGGDMMLSLANGILSGAANYVVPAVESVAGDIESMIGFSEPDVGPLSNFHTFAPDMMQLFAQGIRDGAGLVRAAVGDSFDLGPLIGAQNAGQSFNYGGVSVVINAAEGQSADELYEVFAYRLQHDVVEREAAWR